MNIKKAELLRVAILVPMVLVVFTASAMASMKVMPYPKAPGKKTQDMTYVVQSTSLEGVRQALVNINLHLREEGRSRDQEIKVVIHGPGVVLFHKDTIDPELKYMVEWFLDEGIRIGLCEGCVYEYGLLPQSMFSGLILWKTATPENLLRGKLK